MTSATEGSVRVGEPTGALIVPVGIAGVNAFSTPGWWSSALSAPDCGRAQQRTIERPGAAVAVVTDDSRGDIGSSVLMITRPLVDWLPAAVQPNTTEDRIQPLVEWSESVLAWTVVAPVRMIITRTDPRTISDLVAAAAGTWAVADPIITQPAGAAEDFERALHNRLHERRTATSGLDHLRSRAAIDAVALGTDLPKPENDDVALRSASIDIRERLSSGGVSIHGPRTGLVWPAAPAVDLPLDVAAEASLAVLLAALEPAAQPGEPPDTQGGVAVRQDLQQRLQAAHQELARRRGDPQNLRRVRARSLLKRVVLGRHGG